MQHLLVVYDIPDNKTRRLVSDILEGYGLRVNRSVFECRVKNARHRRRLEAALLHEIDPAVDSIRIYPLCAASLEGASVLGNEPEPFERDAVYFF
jgi:CRISPR-associated protein Cas2